MCRMSVPSKSMNFEKGLENDALKEIDKTIAVYGDDG